MFKTRVLYSQIMSNSFLLLDESIIYEVKSQCLPVKLPFLLVNPQIWMVESQFLTVRSSDPHVPWWVQWTHPICAGRWQHPRCQKQEHGHIPSTTGAQIGPGQGPQWRQRLHRCRAWNATGAAVGLCGSNFFGDVEVQEKGDFIRIQPQI